MVTGERKEPSRIHCLLQNEYKEWKLDSKFIITNTKIVKNVTNRKFSPFYISAINCIIKIVIKKVKSV